jgi:hypothetical protein
VNYSNPFFLLPLAAVYWTPGPGKGRHRIASLSGKAETVIPPKRTAAVGNSSLRLNDAAGFQGG